MPYMPDLVVMPSDFCNKLWHIGIVDFGRAGGVTCKWKTPYCGTVCYARKGLFVLKNNRKRLAWVEQQDAASFYKAVVHRAELGYPIRVGRTGDCANPAITRAICDALETTGVPFMWPTRCWLNPHSESWQIIEECLPRQVLCSMDPWTVARGLKPPKGWPVSYITPPAEEAEEWGLEAVEDFDVTPMWDLGYDILSCPHYPTPESRYWKKPPKNCRQCRLCYHPAGVTDRPNVAFALHTQGGTKSMPEPAQRREGYREGHFLRRWGRGLPVDGLGYEEGAACGVMTPDGWYSPGDDV